MATSPGDVSCTCVQVLLLKGANKLARNKKGRKPGDVFSPTVEEENKERIKAMLGMGGDSISTVVERPVDPSRPVVVSRPRPPSEPSVPNKVRVQASHKMGLPLCLMALR